MSEAEASSSSSSSAASSPWGLSAPYGPQRAAAVVASAEVVLSDDLRHSRVHGPSRPLRVVDHGVQVRGEKYIFQVGERDLIKTLLQHSSN